MEWYELSIITNSEAVDAITNFLGEMNADFSIQDPSDLLGKNAWLTDDTIIDKEIIDIESVIVKAYFPVNSEIENIKRTIDEYLQEISQFVNVGEKRLTVAIIEQMDWENEWKKYYKPTKVGQSIVVKPVWEEYSPSENEVILELDPGLAFGTGTHETTTMCMKHLEKYVDENSTVLDVGCGSGILSICASKLGANKVVGIDIDEIAIKASNENAAINNINNIKFIKGNLFDDINDKYSIIVANIVADIIISMSSSIKEYLNNDGLFIASGIIEERQDEVKKSLVKNGFMIIDEIHEGGWVSIVTSFK